MRVLAAALFGICLAGPVLAQDRPSIGRQLQDQLQQQLAPNQRDGVRGREQRDGRDRQDYDQRDDSTRQGRYQEHERRDGDRYGRQDDLRNDRQYDRTDRRDERRNDR